jgi:hypothetical protein
VSPASWRARTRYCKTQQWVANEAAVSVGYVRLVECGQVRANDALLKTYARHFRLDMHELQLLRQ